MCVFHYLACLEIIAERTSIIFTSNSCWLVFLYFLFSIAVFVLKSYSWPFCLLYIFNFSQTFLYLSFWGGFGMVRIWIPIGSHWFPGWNRRFLVPSVVELDLGLDHEIADVRLGWNWHFLVPSIVEPETNREMANFGTSGFEFLFTPDGLNREFLLFFLIWSWCELNKCV